MMHPRGAAQELYQSVMDAITAPDNIKINGGDDINDNIHIPLFFPVKISLFYCYFSFAKAHISIFGSTHWTLKTVLNVVTSSEHHC